MLIRSLTLENVKSYRNATINFSEGINFIHGVNGAGKSTIIESIGFVLFDSRELRYGELVRYGERQARISLEFEADDGRVYRVERRFTENKQISWSVYDVETDSELLELHGGEDVTNWLKQIMRLDEEIILADIFHDVIGVPQGTFTAPFLETPSKRRSTFDGILKVEGYRLAADRLRAPERQLDENIHEIDKDLALKKQRVEGYDEVIKEHEEAKSRLESLEKGRFELEKEMGTKRQELKELENIKLELDKAYQEQEMTSNRLETLAERLEELQEEVRGGELAVIELEQYAPGYEEYLRVERDIEELEERQQVWQGLKDSLAELKQSTEKVKATIKSKEESRLHLQEDSKRLETGIQEIEENLEKEDRMLHKEKERLDSWSHEIDSFSRLAGTRKEDSRDLSKGIDEYVNGIVLLTQHIVPSIKEKEIQLMGLEQLAEEVNVLDSQQESLNELLARRHRLAERMDTFRFSQSKAQGGNCPFLEEPCQNIEGDNLTEYFDEALVAMEKELENLDGEISALKQLIGLDNAREKLGELRILAEQLEIEQKRKREHEIALRERRKLLAGHHLFTDSELLKRARGIKESVTNGEIEEGILVIEQTKEAIDRLVFVILSKGLDWEDEARVWSELNRYVEKLQEDIGQLAKTMERAYGFLEKDVASKEASLKQRYTSLQNEKKRLFDQLEMERKSEEEISNLRANLEDNLKQVRVYEEEIKKGEHINTDLRKRKERKQELSSIYSKYLEKKPLADGLVDLLGKRDKQIEAIAKEEKRLKEIQETTEVLAGRYQEESHILLKGEIEDLVGKIGALSKEIEERLDDITTLSEKIELMEGILEVIKRDEEILQRKRKARELLSLSRKLLREAAEPIADVLRQYVSVDANRYYQQISKENVQLLWDMDYEVVLLESNGGGYKRRSFKQLSGGEQMSAALAVRLALLKNLSSVGLGFFDEPTTNLDGNRRFNLAEILQRVNTEFNQLFLISHDDTFDSITEHVIHLEKEKETVVK